MLVSMKDLMDAAERERYAVGMFNVMTAEMLRAVWEAAQEARSPVIIGTSEGMAKFLGVENTVALVKTAVEASDIPAALHLDHATKFDIIKDCIAAGYTSVMIDASAKPFHENVNITQEVAIYARDRGVTVEAELGRIMGVEDIIAVTDREAAMTVPEEARQFVAETGVDALAVAIGNAHGMYKGRPELDFERLQAIQDEVRSVSPECRLVLHGGTGIPDDDIRRAIGIGIRKINIATELQMAFMNTARKIFQGDPKVYDPRKILGPGVEEMKRVTLERMEVFGSAGRV